MTNDHAHHQPDYDYFNGPPLRENISAPNLMTTLRPMPNTPGAHDHHAHHAGHANHAGHNAELQHDPSAIVSTPNPHEGHNTGGHDMSMMKMYFNFDYPEAVLFSFWKIDSVAGMVGSCIGLFLLAVLYEGLKVFREWLQERFICRPFNRNRQRLNSTEGPVVQTPINGDNHTPLNPPEESEVHFDTRPGPFSAGHWIQSALHVLQTSISFLLMLVVMTYNVWLCLAVVFGAGVGHLLFGWKRRVLIDVNEHCH